jgi:hypothetical protein
LEDRAPQWIAAGVIVSVKLIAAALLFWLTVKTFDRCLGRASELQRADPFPGKLLSPKEPSEPAHPDEMDVSQVTH